MSKLASANKKFGVIKSTVLKKCFARCFLVWHL